MPLLRSGSNQSRLGATKMSLLTELWSGGGSANSNGIQNVEPLDCALETGSCSRLLALRFLLRLRRGDFLPGRRAPGLPRRAGEDHVPIGTPSGRV